MTRPVKLTERRQLLVSTLSVVHTGDPTLVKNVGTDRLNSSPDVRDAGMQLAHGGLTHRRPQTPGT